MDAPALADKNVHPPLTRTRNRGPTAGTFHFHSPLPSPCPTSANTAAPTHAMPKPSPPRCSRAYALPAPISAGSFPAAMPKNPPAPSSATTTL